MISLIIIGAILVMVVGLAAKFILDKVESDYRIDRVELAIASAVLLLLIVPLVAWVGTRFAISNQVTFNENWGGFEVRAVWVKTPCERDGSMKHYYKGDPYDVWVDTSYTDADGNYHSEGHYETHYHDIPYTTEEWTFTIETTIGDYVIADRNLPTNPNAFRYRADVSVPSNLPSGIPQFWTDAKVRLDRGDPGPVTRRMEYENYILGSQHTILKRFSGDVDRYKNAGLLPNINGSIHSFYHSDRVYFVGVQPAGDWQAAINRFDGALGNTLQGDLHLVVVDANKVSDPDNFTGALIAHWMSSQFDKNALSKNGIVVVLGTVDGRSVAWARAGTGMPEGNEAMLVDIQNGLKGVSLDPASILGRPQATVVGGGVRISHPEPRGALGKIVWGDHAFKRVRMGKPGQPGNVGYSYLLREIEPTGTQRALILLATVLLSCIAWGICIAHGAPRWRSSFGYSRYRRF